MYFIASYKTIEQDNLIFLMVFVNLPDMILCKKEIQCLIMYLVKKTLPKSSKDDFGLSYS